MESGRWGLAAVLVSLAPLLVQCGDTEKGSPAATGGSGQLGGSTAGGGKAGAGDPNSGGAGSGGAGSGGVAGALAGYTGFAGHTSGCVVNPCLGYGCGDPCGYEQCKALPICTGPQGGGGAGGEASGGESAGGAGGQSSATPPPPPASLTACYPLPGYDDAACLPPDDALLSWLSLPAACEAHIAGASTDATPGSCCYRVTCAN